MGLISTLKKILDKEENKPVKMVGSILDIIEKGEIFIDCGANFGQETPAVAAKGAEVYAFEPNPFAFKALEEKCKGLKNVHLYNKAVLDENSEMKLYFHENSDQDEVIWSFASSLVESKSNVSKEKFKVVEVIDLAEFIKKLNKHIKVLKIDVEGVECRIINKLIGTEIYKDIDYILVETHEKQIPTIQDDVENLKKRIADLKITNIDLTWI